MTMRAIHPNHPSLLKNKLFRLIRTNSRIDKIQIMLTMKIEVTVMENLMIIAILIRNISD
jgi:hypothetical protein